MTISRDLWHRQSSLLPNHVFFFSLHCLRAKILRRFRSISMSGKHPKANVGTLHAAQGRRMESDSMGQIEVPADRYWGAQTQRSLVHFSIGDDRMPKRVYHAYGYVKKAAGLVNAAAGRLPQWKADAIVRAADEAIAGKLDEHFPLYVWQTG